MLEQILRPLWSPFNRNYTSPPYPLFVRITLIRVVFGFFVFKFAFFVQFDQFSVVSELVEGMKSGIISAFFLFWAQVLQFEFEFFTRFVFALRQHSSGWKRL